MEYKIKITKTHYSYGYNAKHRHYKVESEHFVAIVNHIAHKGYDAIQVTRKNESHDSFISLNAFMQEFYAENLEKYFSNLKEGESVEIIIKSKF